MRRDRKDGTSSGAMSQKLPDAPNESESAAVRMVHSVKRIPGPMYHFRGVVETERPHCDAAISHRPIHSGSNEGRWPFGHEYFSPRRM